MMYLQKSASMSPRTSLSNLADTHLPLPAPQFYKYRSGHLRRERWNARLREVRTRKHRLGVLQTLHLKMRKIGENSNPGGC